MMEGIGRFDHSRYGYCVVALCQGRLHNRDFYAFVAVEPHNYPYFKKLYRPRTSSNFDAYGLELLRGWGCTPPEDIVDFVRRRYEIEFAVERPFVERMVALTNNPASSPFPLKPAVVPGS